MTGSDTKMARFKAGHFRFGDVIELEVEKIGILKNHVERQEV
jgi:hypothetical protein